MTRAMAAVALSVALGLAASQATHIASGYLHDNAAALYK